MRILATTLSFAILLGSVVNTVEAKEHAKNPLVSDYSNDYDDISGSVFRDIMPPDLIGRLKRASPYQDSVISIPQDDPEPLLLEEQRYNASVTAACRKAVESSENTVNTSGIVACYNIPFFDHSSGKFVADIRLYQTSEPGDVSVGLSPSEYTLEVTIPQAALFEPRHINAEDRSDGSSSFPMLHGLQHVGQLNPQIQLDKLSLYALPFTLY